MEQGQDKGLDPKAAQGGHLRLVDDDLADAMAAIEAAERAELELKFGIPGVDLRELQLQRDKDGKVKGLVNNLANAASILEKAWALRGMLGYDEFNRAPVIWYEVPEVSWDEQHQCWMQTDPPRMGRPMPFEDKHVARIQLWLQRAGRMPNVTAQIAQQAASLAAHANGFHPIREYLRELKWDGTPRVQGIFSEMFGVEDNEYSRRVSEIFFVSCVRRVMDPGCKADYMMILEGKQGYLKSTFFDVLAGAWFSDGLSGNVEHKDASQHLRGKWIIEVAELTSMRKSESDAMKQFIARRVERFRPSYGREEVVEPRQCVFVGTTNEQGYLKDETGNRRYLPLYCHRRLDREKLVELRDQLWAEAVQMWRDGVTNWPTPEFEEMYMMPEQAARVSQDAWYDTLEKYLKGMGSVKKVLTSMDLAKTPLGFQENQVNALVKARIKKTMLQLGWEFKKSNGSWAWHRPKG